MSIVSKSNCFIALSIVCCLMQPVLGDTLPKDEGRCAFDINELRNSAENVASSPDLEDEIEITPDMVKIDPILILLEEVARLKDQLIPYDTYINSKTGEITLTKNPTIAAMIAKNPNGKFRRVKCEGPPTKKPDGPRKHRELPAKPQLDDEDREERIETLMDKLVLS